VNSGHLVKHKNCHNNKWQVPLNIVKNVRVPYSAWNILDSRAIHTFSEAFQAIE
jgi:hypothetical protein